MRIGNCCAVRNLFLWLCAPIFGAAQAVTPPHPLDALTTREYWSVYDILHASGKIDPDTAYATVMLHEPAKDKVLAWKPGDSIPREADAMLVRKGVVIQARVDITAGKLESWKEFKGVQAPMMGASFGNWASW